MEIIIAWVFASFIVALLAIKNGRSGFAYFLLSVILSPLLTGLLVLVIGKSGNVAQGHAPGTAPSAPGLNETRCPDCREVIRSDARKCKHCGTALTSNTPTPPPVDKTPAKLPANW